MKLNKIGTDKSHNKKLYFFVQKVLNKTDKAINILTHTHRGVPIGGLKSSY
jgi:hypothetical protein